MTKNEALKLALEALETSTDWDANATSKQLKFMQAVIAFRQELAQPVQETVACRFCHSKKGSWVWQCYQCDEIDDVQKPTPPAAQPVQEPEQEPVISAWSLREVYFDEDGEPSMHRSLPAAQPEQEPVGKLQEPTVERAWFTIAELNAWANKKILENPQPEENK